MLVQAPVQESPVFITASENNIGHAADGSMALHLKKSLK